MSVRALLAVAVALGVGGTAASVPLLVDGPLVTLDLPEFAPVGGASGHAGHASHPSHASAAHATHAARTAHAHATGAQPADADAGEHGDHSGSAAAGAPAYDADGHGDHAGGLGDQPGMQRPAFPPAQGKVPTSTEGLKQMPTTRVLGDDDLDALATKGSGTLSDPYVLRGLYFPGSLDLLDTDACVVLLENWFGGQLALNWNGQCVWVHHNRIHDLRVNENIPRSGYATGGLLEENVIGIIGQLRHYDGEFRHNKVGPRAPDPFFDPVAETVPYLFLTDTRVANIDGFNQGWIHHNTFLGTVDLDLHGHHHGTGFFAPHSHYHGESSTRQAEHMHDHTDRWTSVSFTDNTIVDPEGYGLRYEDENHAGDDQSATSEDMEVLEDPHVHHTDITLARNTVTGGQIWIDIFNADDARNHKSRNPGTLTIEGNTVETHEREDESPDLCIVRFGNLYDARSAIHVVQVKELELFIVGNTLRYVPLPASTDLLTAVRDAVNQCALAEDEHAPTAVRIQNVRDGRILIEGNRASGVRIGVAGLDMDKDTTWRVVGNQFGASSEVDYDDTVMNDPERS